MSTASPPLVTHTIKLLNQEETLALLGQRDEHLRLLEENSPNVRIVVRGDNITVTGEAPDVERTTQLLAELLSYLRRGERLTRTTVRYLVNMMRQDQPEAVGEVLGPAPILLRSRRGLIRAKTRGQSAYLQAMARNDIVFGIGPAGTGKTYLAVAVAVAALEKKEVERLILARPAVEAGENLGFLPGDLRAKVDPFLRPLYDALHDMLGFEYMRELLERGTVEIAPLAYMRGRTLNHSYVILDEAQNTTRPQMKMFLTRLGSDSKAVITGDVTQIDLPPNRKSGLIEAEEILKGIQGIAFVRFNKSDVVRHRLVEDIVDAYEQADSRNGERAES